MSHSAVETSLERLAWHSIVGCDTNETGDCQESFEKEEKKKFQFLMMNQSMIC